MMNISVRQNAETTIATIRGMTRYISGSIPCESSILTFPATVIVASSVVISEPLRMIMIKFVSKGANSRITTTTSRGPNHPICPTLPNQSCACMTTKTPTSKATNPTGVIVYTPMRRSWWAKT